MKRKIDAFSDRFDILVIGGGITGAGIALDATLRGFRVGLLDKGDFASGTSSVSSKLVHGGLRYLEHGDFQLVYEALHERGLLLENAPHLVHPLRFLIPFYRGARVPPWKYRIGLTLYDLLAGAANIRRSRPMHRSEMLAGTGLRGNGLTGGAAYFDAQMDDARLCLEVVKTAADQGAAVANYLEMTGFERNGEAITGVRARDRIGDRELIIRARQVICAAGPWTDGILKLAGYSSGPCLRPTKGVHLVAPDRGLTAAFLLLHPADGRVFFVIPWLGKTLVGTTDTFDHDSPDNLTMTPADVAYLLQGHNGYFDPRLNEADVLGTFVGLRPLLHAQAGEPAAVSRESRLIEAPGGLLAIAGGKFTTYRSMAEQVTDAAVGRLGSRQQSRSRHFLLDGAPRSPWPEFQPREIARLQTKYALSPAAARHLICRYGRRAADVASYIERDAGLAEPITPEEADIRAELVYHREHEMAQTAADSLLRRTRLGLFHPRLLQEPDTCQQ